MRERIKKITNTRQFHICMVAVIIVAIIFVSGVTALKYNVEGESTPPFNISKMSIISNVDGIDVEDSGNKWNLSVNQNNDIYLYIKKNEKYKYTETIESVVFDNFNIIQKPKVGQVKLFRPDENMDSAIFKNNEENETNCIEFKGDTDSSIKDMKISNQGGLIVFRYSITGIGNYISNDDEEINHNELLKKLSINNEDLKFLVSFDININLDSNKCYKTNVNLELPIGNVVDDGIQSKENTDLEVTIHRLKK